MVRSLSIQFIKVLWIVLFCRSVSVIADVGGAPIITEASSMAESVDPQWWLSSGAYVYRTDGVITTVQGELAQNDRFRLLYAKSNPIDTDIGYHPQNLLRLVTLAQFKNFTQQVFFNIKNINSSNSPNRNQSNGVFLLHRYLNSDNLYYVGIRVDGNIVVKKKLDGVYYPLKSLAVYQGQYHRDTLPNLLPVNRWIGIKSVITDNTTGNVDIKVYLRDDLFGSGWIQVLEVEDAGIDGKRILNEGHAGIRTDFMDVSFEHYEAVEGQQ